MNTNILTYNSVLNLETLLEKLQQDFPDKMVKKSGFGKNIMVRKSNFTTQNVTLIPQYKKNRIKLSTSLDVMVLYFLFCWPLGLYVFINRKKHQALKQEVIDNLNNYHNSQNI